ncbi:MAG: carboxypeptidase-like regulatory domain-containing protein [Planctomycetota bacterium]
MTTRSPQSGSAKALALLIVFALVAALVAAMSWLMFEAAPDPPDVRADPSDRGILSTEPGDEGPAVSEEEPLPPDPDRRRFDPDLDGPKARIVGTVTRDGLPVSAEVYAWRIVDGQPRRDPRTKETDRDGLFDFDPIARGEYLLDAFAKDAAAIEPVPVTVAPGEVRSDIRIELTSRCSVSGSVRDEEGFPIGDALIVARALVRDVPGADRVDRHETESSIDGGYRLEGLRRNAEYVFEVSKVSHAPIGDPVSLRVPKDLRLDLGLMANGVLAGLVLLREEPAVVGIAGTDRKAPTDDEGFFRFVGVPGNRRPIELFAVSTDRKWIGTNEFVYLGHNRRDINISLETALSLRGVLKTEKGRTIQRARVAVEEETEGGWDQPRAWKLLGVRFEVTSYSGDFELRGLEARRRYRIFEAEPTLLPSSEEFVEVTARKGIEPVELVVVFGASILGNVRTTQGLPAEGQEVQVRLDEEIVARSPVQGDGSYRIVGLFAGEYRVDVAWRDRLVSLESKSVELREGDRRSIDFEVSGEGLVYGRVVTPDGEPASSAKVTLRHQVGNRLASEVACDADGRYRFDRILPGRYELNVVADGWAMTRSAATLDWGDRVERDIVLQAPRALRVRILPESRDRVEIMLVPEVGRAQEETGVAGSLITFEELSPGELEVFARTLDGRQVVRRRLELNEKEVLGVLELTLQPSVSIRGRVEGLTEHMRGMEVELRREPFGGRLQGVRLRPDLSFHFEGLFPGVHYLWVRGFDRTPTRIVVGEQDEYVADVND